MSKTIWPQLTSVCSNCLLIVERFSVNNNKAEFLFEIIHIFGRAARRLSVLGGCNSEFGLEA